MLHVPAIDSAVSIDASLAQIFLDYGCDQIWEFLSTQVKGGPTSHFDNQPTSAPKVVTWVRGRPHPSGAQQLTRGPTNASFPIVTSLDHRCNKSPTMTSPNNPSYFNKKQRTIKCRKPVTNSPSSSCWHIVGYFIIKISFDVAFWVDAIPANVHCLWPIMVGSEVVVQVARQHHLDIHQPITRWKLTQRLQC